MVNDWVRPLGSAIGSFIAVTGIALLPAGTASAAPIPRTIPAAVQATSVLMNPLGEIVPPAQPPPGDADRRLANGQFLRSGSRTGKGELTIDNGSDRDAVITMAMNSNPVYSVYVRKGSMYTVQGIRDSTYEIFFTIGTDWDSQNFTRDRALQRFDQTFNFTTTRTATELRWTTGKITLNPVVGGNASTSPVDPKDYPGV